MSKKLNYAKGNYQDMFKEIQKINWPTKLQFLSLSDSNRKICAREQSLTGGETESGSK